MTLLVIPSSRYSPQASFGMAILRQEPKTLSASYVRVSLPHGTRQIHIAPKRTFWQWLRRQTPAPIVKTIPSTTVAWLTGDHLARYNTLNHAAVTTREAKERIPAYTGFTSPEEGARFMQLKTAAEAAEKALETYKAELAGQLSQLP